MTIAEIKQLADKEWVKGPIKGRISSTKNVTDTMSAGKLGDDEDTIDLTAFGKDIRKFDGKEVVLTGMGMRKDSRNGYDKLVINEKTKISVEGDAPPQKMESAHTGKTYAPKADDDFVDQTLCHFVGAAGHLAMHDPASDGQMNVELGAEYAVYLYRIKQRAAEIIRNDQ